MDLSSGEFQVKDLAETGAWCQLLHPATGEEMGVDYVNSKQSKPTRIRVKGADSETYAKAVAHSVAMRNRETPNKKKRVTEDMIMDASEKNDGLRAVELAKVTIGWENLSNDGKKFEFNHDNAVWLYTNHPWIAEQVASFFVDRTNFLGKE